MNQKQSPNSRTCVVEADLSSSDSRFDAMNEIMSEVQQNIVATPADALKLVALTIDKLIIDVVQVMDDWDNPELDDEGVKRMVATTVVELLSASLRTHGEGEHKALRNHVKAMVGMLSAENCFHMRPSMLHMIKRAHREFHSEESRAKREEQKAKSFAEHPLKGLLQVVGESIVKRHPASEGLTKAQVAYIAEQMCVYLGDKSQSPELMSAFINDACERIKESAKCH